MDFIFVVNRDWLVGLFGVFVWEGLWLEFSLVSES